VTEEVSNNIITFPRTARSLTPVLTLDQMSANMINTKKEMAEIAAIQLADELLFKINMYGFPISTEKCFKDAILVIEAIKSLILRSLDVDHELQEFVNEMNTDDKKYEVALGELQETNED